MTRPSWRDLAVVFSVVIGSSVLAYATLTTGHDWGDDFAAYISQAISVLHGTMAQTVARNAFTMRESSYPYGPVAAPWGYPILLAPAYLACGGLNMFCLKLPNTIVFGLALIVFFWFLRRRLPLADSAILVAVIGFSPELLQFQDNILSDLTFLLCSMLAIVLIETTVVEGPAEAAIGSQMLLGAVLFLAFFVRTVGLTLVPTLFVAQAIRSRSLKATRFVPYAVFLGLALAATWVFPSGDTSSVAFYRTITPGQILENIQMYATEPRDFFMSVPLNTIWFPALVPFLAAGAWSRRRSDYHVTTYCAVTLLVLVAWPFDEGLRYLIPLLPFLVYLTYQGMLAAAHAILSRYRVVGIQVVRFTWAAVAAIFVSTSILAARVNLQQSRVLNDGPFQPSSAEMFDWVRSNLPPASVVSFWRPRLMRLLTDRDAIFVDDCRQLDRGQYAVIRKASGDHEQVRLEAFADIARCNPSLQALSVFENKDYVAYKILRREPFDDTQR